MEFSGRLRCGGPRGFDFDKKVVLFCVVGLVSDGVQLSVGGYNERYIGVRAGVGGELAALEQRRRKVVDVGVNGVRHFHKNV